MNYTIAIVDDHILIARALSELVTNFANYSVLFEVENGTQLIEKFRIPKNIPDIVLLDIAMPEMDGYATAAWLKANYPTILVVALTAQADDLSLVNMIKAGARGYVLKNTHPKSLEQALDFLVANGYYYPEWAASKIFSAIANDAGKKPHISERENDFLKYCCTELTYKEIAEKMFCSVHTVEGYRDSLFDKLNLKSRVGLAVYAIKNGKCKI